MKAKRVIALLLILILVIAALCGCNKKESEASGTTAGSENESNFNQAIEYSSTILATEKKSDYVIVIPESPSEYIQFAATELQTLFCEATGVELPILTDENAVVAADGKYISVGRNKLQAESGIKCDYKIYRESGARLVTKGDCMILTGASDEGALYAVYDFLKVLFDYEFYDVDA